MSQIFDSSVARKRIASQIEKAREDRNLTLRDLARLVARDPARLSEIETGRANPSLDNLVDLGDALGLELVMVPKEKLDQVLRLILDEPQIHPPADFSPTSREDVLIDGSHLMEEDDEATNGYR